MNNKINPHIDAAYEWLSKSPADWGQLLDHIAMARQELRNAMALEAAASTPTPLKEEKKNG